MSVDSSERNRPSASLPGVDSLGGKTGIEQITDLINFDGESVIKEII